VVIRRRNKEFKSIYAKVPSLHREINKEERYKGKKEGRNKERI
jgi:hypothetical protein